MEAAIAFRTSLARAFGALVARRRARDAADDRPNPASAIQGQLLRLSERREVAIYLREGTLWVADFIDGRGELVDAATWFRFNCGVPGASWSRRRMLLESALPLSWDLVGRIEELHRLEDTPTRIVSPESRAPRRDQTQELTHGPLF
jgi:hypothetical protein